MIASVALQIAVQILDLAMTHASLDDALAARSAAMGTIGRAGLGRVKGKGDWTAQPIGLARAGLAAATSVAISGAAAYVTLALAVAMVTP